MPKSIDHGPVPIVAPEVPASKLPQSQTPTSPAKLDPGAALKQASGADYSDSFQASSSPEETPSTEPINKYAQTTDANGLVKRIVKFILGILWSIGGKSDAEDGLPRLGSRDIQPILKDLKPGDIVLNGNNGGLSHAAMYVGDGQIVHSMATNDTMRGTQGSILDSIKRMFGFGPENPKTGVFKEGLGEFFDRFERDTYVVVRRDDLSDEQVSKGVDKIHGLIGKGYDYDFSAGDDEYYCTEIVIEYLDAALGKKDSTNFETEHHDYKILSTDAVAPEGILKHESLTPVIANAAALGEFSERLEKIPIFDVGGVPHPPQDTSLPRINP